MTTRTRESTEPTTTAGPLSSEELRDLDAWWRAANYVSVGQIYLLANPLLRQPLLPEHIKPRLLGHWGTTPGLNFIHAHMNRIIRAWDQDAITIIGPGHGGPAAVANAWLAGTWSETYPDTSQDAEGMLRLFHQFSFPGGIGSHVTAHVPGSIHEGGELGYALAHAYGAAFDKPDLLVCCVVGDGEAETGPLAASWHSNKFLSPASDGAVLPILHLNGYKIANPTVLARIPQRELDALMEGYGYRPMTVQGDDPALVHQQMAAALDEAMSDIRGIQKSARASRSRSRPERPRWPMIVLRTPKGWTGPKEVDGRPVEGTHRAHQVPLLNVRSNPQHLAMLESWMRGYRPEELFERDGRPNPALRALAPKKSRRMTSNPVTNAGGRPDALAMPDFRDYAVTVEAPGAASHEPTRVLGQLLRDVVKRNPSTFRIFGPDETTSNRLDAVLDVTARAFEGEILPGDDHLAPEGRVVEVLSEHLCQGWLE